MQKSKVNTKIVPKLKKTKISHFLNSIYMNIKIGYVFNRKNYLNREGKALIQVRVYDGRKNYYYSTSQYIEPSGWNEKKQAAKDNQVQIVCDKIRSKIIDWSEKNVFDWEKLRAYLEGKVETTDFIGWAKNQLSKRAASLSESTINNHHATFAFFESYLLSNRRNLELTGFTIELLYDFHGYGVKKGLSINSLARHHEVVRYYLNLAKNDGLISQKQYCYNRYQIKRQKIDRSYLDSSEIELLENYRTENLTNRQVIDLFLIGCYTGLRWGDIETLGKKDIEEKEGQKYIVKKNAKTTKISRLNISKLFKGKALQILEKYDYILPKYTNVYVNDMLKIIGSELGLQKKLHFHISRHTFATYLLNMGLDLVTLQSLLNHASISTTQHYAKLAQSTINQKLDLIFEK